MPRVRALRDGFVGESLTCARTLGRRPGGRDDREIAVRAHQGDSGRGELAALGRGLAHQIIQFGAGFRPHDRFVGRAQRREHARQAFLLLLGPRLFFGAIEIIQRERDVVGQPLQHFDEFRRERVLLARR